MQSEKRGTLDHYFLSSNKKSCDNEQQVEPSIIVTSTLSTPEIQSLASSELFDDHTLSDSAINSLKDPFVLSSSSNEKSYKKVHSNWYQYVMQ